MTDARRYVLWHRLQRGILVVTLGLCAGCATSSYSQSVSNPFHLKLLVDPAVEPVRIAIVDSDADVFAPETWGLIKRQPPWQLLAEVLGGCIGRTVQFEQLKPFQIAFHLESGRCHFALVSDEAYELTRERGVGAWVLVEARVLRRQGVIVAEARAGIESLADLQGRPFAFCPRTDRRLFRATLELLEKAGVVTADITNDAAGSERGYVWWKNVSGEVAGGAEAGVMDANEYDAFLARTAEDSSGGVTFGKDRFIELARTEPFPADTIRRARLVATDLADPALLSRIRSCLLSVHENDAPAVQALGFSRFVEPGRAPASPAEEH